MMQAPSELDIKAALQHPRSFFAEPKDVVAHPTLSREMKLAILQEWELDARRRSRLPRAGGSVAARRVCSDASKTSSRLFESKGERAMQQEPQLSCRSYQGAVA